MEAHLVKAFRTSDNEVKALYVTDDRREFVVTWNNIHPSTGEEGFYDLQIDCLSRYEDLNKRVEEAINEGETDDNTDLDLYLCIRDKFDRYDCEELSKKD